jgi:acetyl esterase/lipase
MKRTDGPAPDLQLLIYPATDLVTETPSLTTYADAFPLTRETMDWFMAHYLPHDADRGDLRISPGRASDLSGLAPAFIYTAGFDPLVDQGAAYAQKLASAGVETTYHCFDSLAHGFTAFTGVIPAADAACRRMAEEVAAFLKRLD